MIETSCECGGFVRAAEGALGQAIRCDACRESIAIVSAEAMAEGTGAGDFDAHLRIVAGPSRVGAQMALGGIAEITIGQQADRHIKLTGTRVSRTHCKLRRIDFGPSRWELLDEKSTNGIFVNGNRVQQAELRSGDQLKIGEFELTFINTLERDKNARAAATKKAAIAAGAGTCPSCGEIVAPKAKVCVNCGVDLKTGRSLVVSKGLDENDLAIRADTWSRIISWFIWFGLFPIASEALGTREPKATWAIFIVTCAISIVFALSAMKQADEHGELPPSLNALLQWNGDYQISSSRSETLRRQLQEIIDEDLQDRRQVEAVIRHERLNSSPNIFREFVETRQAEYDARQAKRIERARPIERQLAELGAIPSPTVAANAHFHVYQLFTSALLHDPSSILRLFAHLGGNMLFLLVFGLRINELMGNWRTAVVYPILAAASGLSYHIVEASSPLHPSLGASGAVMGIAGMYFVFFPLQRVHMLIWLRIPLLMRCALHVFQMRGLWLLVLWIALNDLLPVVFHRHDHVAHWAHLGGFTVGMLLAMMLLVTRQVSARGTDLISVVLGRRAWKILGTPGANVAPIA